MKMKGRMNSYTIEVVESRFCCISVSAASETEAIEKAAREYRNQGGIPEEHYYESVDFKVTERRLRNGVYRV